jgi:kynurenine formamidase
MADSTTRPANVPVRVAPVPGWERGRGWGWIWGEEDEIGALNAMTEESVREALAGVSQGRVFDLGLTVDRSSYLSPFHVKTSITSHRTARDFKRDLELDPAGVSFNTSLVVVSDHAGTQIDGLCHATWGSDDHFYNGFTSADFAGDHGVHRASVAGMPPIVLTAVLVDVAGHLGQPNLDPGFAIGPELLADVLAARDADIAPGEAVFVRTGSLRHWGVTGSDHAALSGPDTAGITLAAARWLVEEKGAILIGSDTSTLEVMPPADGAGISPVHAYLLVEQGVHMGELHHLEEVAATGITRFCYVALTPKLRGTTGGFAMRPLAVV